MRKLFTGIVTLILILVFSIQTKSQSYQISNSNFETWDNTSNTSEPTNWNSFPSANCALSGLAALGCSTAKTAHHYKVAGHRTGGNGSNYLTVWSKSVIGVIANGNMTLGQIYMGSTTANSSSNYNLTIRSSGDYSEAFTATPDSLYIWTKYWASSSSSQARISAVIHGNTDFKDPNDLNTATAYSGKAEKQFTRTGSSAGACTWVQQKIPFQYTGSSTRNYMLITFTSNATPGGGSSGDSLSVDDMELIYSAWITDIKLNGTTVNGFNLANYNYYIEYPRGTNPSIFPSVSYTTEVSDVTDTLITYSGVNNGLDSAKSVITVIAEDGVTQKVYTINYTILKSNDSTLSNVGYTLSGNDTILIPSFSSSQKIYNVSFAPGTVAIPSINYYTLTDTGARVIQITQATSPNGQAIIRVRAEDGSIATYTINFSVQLSNNAKLDSLKYNGIQVSGFNADTLAYNVVLTPGTTIAPFVTAKTQWHGLTPAISPASSLPGTTSIVVTAEDGTTVRTYTIAFTVALSTNDSASWIKYNSIAVSNFHPDSLTYHVQLPYGTNSVSLTALPVWSTAQVNVINPSSLPGNGSIHITAEDTNYKRTYNVNFTVAKNPNALLDSLAYTLHGIDYTIQGFKDTTFLYSVELAPKTKYVPVVSARLQNINAHLSIEQSISPSDTTIIHVLAEDSLHTNTYFVVFSVKLDTNANVTYIKMNDSLISGFNASVLNYNIALDSAAIPVFTTLTNDTAARYTILYPSSLPGIVTISVQAEDTNVIKVYRIYLSIKSPNNADLMDIGYTLNNIYHSLSGFDKDTVVYHILLPSLTTYIPFISCQKAVSGSKVTINQPSSPNDTAIITIKSPNDSVVKMYYIFFKVEISQNAVLSSISINGNNLSIFHIDTNYYHLYLHYDSLVPPVVGAIAQSAAAHISIKQATTVNDSAIINILAEDSIHARIYIVHFTRLLSPIATLNQIIYKLNGVDSLVHEFSPNTFTYTVNLKAETVQIPNLFTFPLTDSRANVQLIRSPLHVNDTAIIKVKAENMIDSNVYIVVFHRIASANTCIDTIFINGNPLQIFNKDTLNYTLLLPWSTNQISLVNALASWNLSTINITQAGTYFGKAQLQVIAEDGIHTRTYSVQFVQGSNVDLQSLSYNIEGNTYPISTFHSADTVYHIMLPVATKDIPTLTYTLVDSRCSVDTIPALNPNGEASLVIKGWDGLQQKSYKVEFEVTLSTDAHLADLMIDSVSLTAFNADTLVYYKEFTYGTVELPIVDAKAVEPDAQIIINQINSYPGVATILVKAGDTSITMTYMIYFSVESGNNAYLSELNVNDTLLANFDKNTFLYEYELPYGSTNVPVVSATTEDNRATATVIQAATLNDTAWVVVSAINGTDTRVYGVIYNVALNNDARLAWIKVDGSPISTFDAETNNYKYELPVGYHGIPSVTVETQDTNATYLVTPATAIPGQTKIDVVAHDGFTMRTYRVNFIFANAIEEAQMNSNLLVYPNPVHNVLHIDCETKDKRINKVELYDIFGKLIKQQNVTTHSTTIEIGELPNGIYLLRVAREDRTSSTMKIIKY